MIGLLQRVTSANVVVDGEIIGSINRGLLIFIGVEQNDDKKKATRLIQRILNYRVFADENNRMNLSLSDINGGLLLVPQFTLVADTKKGTRPGFSKAATPQTAELLYDYCVDIAKSQHGDVALGKFSANMQVSLVNDGPVTFWLKT